VIRAINIGGNVNDNPDAPKFFHVDSSNHLIVQRVVLVPATIQLKSESRSPGDSDSTALASLNPFKANPQSQDRGVSSDDRGETRRILLDDALDVGELKPNQRLKGLQLLFTRECVRGAAWSDSELYVSAPRTSRVQVVTHLQGFESDSQRLIINRLGNTHQDLKGITWFGWDTFCATYSVSIRIPLSPHGHSLC
jgi:hypothetical protein